MTEEQKKLIDALETIKNECLSHASTCKDCPIYSEKSRGTCGLMNTRADRWKLNKPETEWRAFL